MNMLATTVSRERYERIRQLYQQAVGVVGHFESGNRASDQLRPLPRRERSQFYADTRSERGLIPCSLIQSDLLPCFADSIRLKVNTDKGNLCTLTTTDGRLYEFERENSKG